jgi:starvation-inducible DNA-binding protein
MTDKLNGLVADFTVFYQKLRHYHWNVKGPEFFQLHTKFEEIYTEVGDQIDEIAERIIALNGVPLHTLAHMLENTTISEDPGMPGGAEMVSNLIADIDTLSASLQAAIEESEANNDRPTTNLLDAIQDALRAHQWMLQAWQQ